MTPTEIRIACGEATNWTPTPGGYWTQNPAGIPTKEFPLCEGIPPFDTSADSALALVDALAKEGWDCYSFGLVKPVVVVATKLDITHKHTAPTLALAICGAFLKTRNLWKE